MKMFALLAVLICVCLFCGTHSLEHLDDVAGSRFVYEYKLMERFIQLQNENAQLAARVTALENAQSKKNANVSAHVRLSKTTHLANTDRVLFDVEVMNIGQAYDLNEGHFTAPVPGLYLIHINTCLNQGGQWIDLNIIKDGGIIGRVFTGDHAYHTCSSALITAHLLARDKVWVARAAGSATALNQDHGWNTFTAVLLRQD